MPTRLHSGSAQGAIRSAEERWVILLRQIRRKTASFDLSALRSEHPVNCALQAWRKKLHLDLLSAPQQSCSSGKDFGGRLAHSMVMPLGGKLKLAWCDLRRTHPAVTTFQRSHKPFYERRQFFSSSAGYNDPLVEVSSRTVVDSLATENGHQQQIIPSGKKLQVENQLLRGIMARGLTPNANGSISDDRSDLNFGVDGRGSLIGGKDMKFARCEVDGARESRRMLEPQRHQLSSAALGHYDGRTERRLYGRFDETKGIGSKIREIRNELRESNASHLTKKRFDELGISPLTIKALTEAGYVHTTVVQESVLPACLEGKDVMVKARTGAGKSLAFLLPVLESVLNAIKSETNHRVSPVYALILCPTRELAVQLAAEVNVLLKYHEGIKSLLITGGISFTAEQKFLHENICQILIATPGRLLDHIENKIGLSAHFLGLKLLVLDEADLILRVGFRKELEKIVDCLPRQRQSLFFSATVLREVRRLSRLVLRRDHVFIDTVGLSGAEISNMIQQLCYVVPHDLHFHMVYKILEDHMNQESAYKVVVFCAAARVAEFLTAVLRGLELNAREVHSKQPQVCRTRNLEEFWDSRHSILVTSDISSYRMNYPDVTLVIQVGIPADRERYICRIGQAGRGGKNGRVVLLLAPWEEYFLDVLKDLPLDYENAPDLDADMRSKVDDAISRIDSGLKEATYHAWVGYYNSVPEIGRDKTSLAERAKAFSRSIGLEEPPMLYRKTAVKMGLMHMPGFRIKQHSHR